MKRGKEEKKKVESGKVSHEKIKSYRDASRMKYESSKQDYDEEYEASRELETEVTTLEKGIAIAQSNEESHQREIENLEYDISQKEAGLWKKMDETEELNQEANHWEGNIDEIDEEFVNMVTK